MASAYIADSAPEAIPLNTLVGEGEDIAEDFNLNSVEGHDQEEGEYERLLSAYRAMKRSQKYARQDVLSQYIPGVYSESIQAQTMRVRMAKRKTMLRIQLIVAVVVATTNICVALWAMTSYPPDSRGVGTLSFGSCSKAGITNSLWHVILNILSSLFLGAGNYCMQIFVAPSRKEMDRAHQRGVSLDIGVPSIKNLRYIDRKRVLLWLATGILATFLHLFWNSAVFKSNAFVSYPYAWVTSDFPIATDDWKASSSHLPWMTWVAEGENAIQNMSLVYSLQQSAKEFTRMDSMSCRDRYIDPLKPTSAVVVVALNVTSNQNNGSSLVFGYVSGWGPWSTSSRWICDYYYTYEDRDYSRWCDRTWADTFSDQWLLDVTNSPTLLPYGLSALQYAFKIDAF